MVVSQSAEYFKSRKSIRAEKQNNVNLYGLSEEIVIRNVNTTKEMNHSNVN